MLRVSVFLLSKRAELHVTFCSRPRPPFKKEEKEAPHHTKSPFSAGNGPSNTPPPRQRMCCYSELTKDWRWAMQTALLSGWSSAVWGNRFSQCKKKKKKEVDISSYWKLQVNNTEEHIGRGRCGSFHRQFGRANMQLEMNQLIHEFILQIDIPSSCCGACMCVWLISL